MKDSKPPDLEWSAALRHAIEWRRYLELPGAGRPAYEPAGTIVESDRPLFRWPPNPAAATYVVSLFKAGSAVIQSPPVRIPFWRPPAPIPREELLMWQVDARTGAGKATIPASPQPLPLFRVISERDALAIEAAKQRHPADHFLIGLLYARAGLLREAERELSMHLESYPRALPLLEMIRQRHQATIRSGLSAAWQ